MGHSGKPRAELEEGNTPILHVPKASKTPCCDLPSGQTLPTPLPAASSRPHSPHGQGSHGRCLTDNGPSLPPGSHGP